MSASSRNLYRKATPAHFYRHLFTTETEQEVLQNPTVTSDCIRQPLCVQLIHNSAHWWEITHIESEMKATCENERLTEETVMMRKLGWWHEHKHWVWVGKVTGIFCTCQQVRWEKQGNYISQHLVILWLLCSAVADHSTQILTFQRRLQEEKNKKSRNVQSGAVK